MIDQTTYEMQRSPWLQDLALWSTSFQDFKISHICREGSQATDWAATDVLAGDFTIFQGGQLFHPDLARLLATHVLSIAYPRHGIRFQVLNVQGIPLFFWLFCFAAALIYCFLFDLIYCFAWAVFIIGVARQTFFSSYRTHQLLGLLSASSCFCPPFVTCFTPELSCY